MKKTLWLVIAAIVTACGPGTPGTEVACGKQPDPSICPSGWICECFMMSCGWGCPGAMEEIVDAGQTDSDR